MIFKMHNVKSTELVKLVRNNSIISISMNIQEKILISTDTRKWYVYEHNFNWNCEFDSMYFGNMFYQQKLIE